MEMNTTLAPLVTAATTARTELAQAALADAKTDATVKAAVDKLRAAELAVATARADAFSKIQAGPNKLSAEQVTALINAGGNVGGGGRGGRGGGG
jgi:membrane protein involved in colicin uptake